MTRGTGGRFDARYEVDSIERGMDQDLQRGFGQSLRWYVYDPEHSVSDDVYDVGAVGGGRRWKAPFNVPVIDAIRTEGAGLPDAKGLYTVDKMHIIVSYDAARLSSLRDLVSDYRQHLKDRIVFQGVVYTPERIVLRGIVQTYYTVVGIDVVQVNSDELVSDVDFQPYALSSGNQTTFMVVDGVVPMEDA